MLSTDKRVKTNYAYDLSLGLSLFHCLPCKRVPGKQLYKVSMIIIIIAKLGENLLFYVFRGLHKLLGQGNNEMYLNSITGLEYNIPSLESVAHICTKYLN